MNRYKAKCPNLASSTVLCPQCAGYLGVFDNIRTTMRNNTRANKVTPSHLCQLNNFNLNGVMPGMSTMYKPTPKAVKMPTAINQ